MRTLQFNSMSRKKLDKSSTKRMNLARLRRRLKRAIEQEKIDVVRKLLSSASKHTEPNSIGISIDQMNEINADLSLVDHTVSNVIETSRPPNRMSLKRPPSSESLSTPRKKSRMLEWREFKNNYKNDWHRRLRVDDKSPGNALHYASRLGKTCFIDLLLELGAFGIDEPNWSDERDTALGIACDLGWLDTAKVLIARGADVNYENKCGKTPLILATELVAPFDLEMSKMLIESGADVNQMTIEVNDTKSSCALLSACSYDNNDLIRYLIAKGARIDPLVRPESNTSTPLFRCVYNGNMEMTEYLLRMGANVHARNVQNETALHIAAHRGHLYIVKMLVGEFMADINSRDKDGDTPLSVACYAANREIIQYLLENGASPRVHGHRGDTPLHIAIANCDRDTCEDLIDHGADVDACNYDNESVLHTASRTHLHRIFKLLVERASNLDMCSKSDMMTPFRCLVEDLSRSRLKMAIILLQAGADPNITFNQPVFESDHFRALIGQESVFDFLFSIFRHRFKLDGLETESVNSSAPIPVNKFLVLIRMILKSGYKLRARDGKMFKDSWLRAYLESTRPVLVEYMDEMFTIGVKKPATLKDLCRVRIRKEIQKPLRPSVQLLDIPVKLKELLCFDIID